MNSTLGRRILTPEQMKDRADRTRALLAERFGHRNVHNPNSPNHNSKAANDTHIPWPIPFVLPY